MLNSETIKMASEFSDAILLNKKSLLVKQNTPLYEVARLSVPPHSINEKEFTIDGFSNAVNYLTGGEGGDSQHNNVSDAIIDDLSKLVNSHLDFAKNTVKPQVIAFAENIIKYNASYIAKSPGDNFEIQSLCVPDVLQDESFLDNLKYYKEKSVLTPDTNIKIDDKDYDEVVKLMLTGYARVDKLIADWISNLPSNFIMNIWDNFFAGNTPKKEITFENISSTNAYERINYGLVIYLISRSLFNDATGSKYTSLAKYKDSVNQMTDYAGALIADSIYKINLFNKNNTLVIELNSTAGVIKVNSEVYKKWLENGGSTDVLFGMIINSEKISSVSLIDNKKDNLIKEWISYVNFYTANEANKKTKYFIDFLHTSFNESMKQLSDEEKEYIEKTRNYYDVINELFEEEVKNIKLVNVDPYDLALAIVGKCRFFYTSAYNILSDINYVTKNNKDIDVREAALIAAINYITDYLTTQISVVE